MAGSEKVCNTCQYQQILKDRPGTFTTVRKVLEEGAGFSFFAGRQLREYLFVEIDYTKSTIAEFSFSTQLLSYPTFKGKIRMNTDAITPSLKMEIVNRKVGLYIKSGLVIGFNNKAFYAREDGYNKWGGYYQLTEKYYGGLAFGFTGSVGMKIRTKHEGSYFLLEAFYRLQNWSPVRSVYTAFNYDYTNMSNLTVYEKETRFTDNPVEQTDSTKPHEVKRFAFPLSTAGIKLAWIFSFNFRKKGNKRQADADVL